MLYFPQLETGAMAQFPLDRRFIRRTILNRTPDGTLLKLDDPAAAGTAWTLQYQGLTEGERAALEELFCDAEGRLRSFTFLDPAGNLLKWSEDLAKELWHKDGAIQLAGEIADQNGGSRASRITNASQVLQGIEQTVDAPGWFRYCFSFSVRSPASTRITLAILNAEGSITSEHIANNEWRLASCSGELGGSADDVTCRLELEAGAAVEVFGFQLEAQPNPSGYRRTFDKSGVHKKCRFAEDELRFVANGIDDHEVTIRVFSPAGEQS
jgi:hypothetical protein